MHPRIPLTWLALIVACGKSAPSAKEPPKDAARPHDETSHDENHFYIAASSKGFDPAILEVPAQQEIILLFYRGRDSPCSRIILDLPDGATRAVGLASAQTTEVHVRFASAGQYGYACDPGTMHGKIMAR